MRTTIFVALLVAVDQVTKGVARAWLKPLGSVRVIPGLFNLSYVENPGAAWGMLAGQQIFLIGFSLITLVFLTWHRQKIFGHLMGGHLIRILLFAGIIGNLIDRCLFAHVVDFLDFYWGNSHFPAFNVADATICCGIFLLLGAQWWHEHQLKAGATLKNKNV